MALNEAVPRLSAGPFSGIMGYFCVAVIDKQSINVEPITIEKLSSESLYSCGGKEAGYFYPLPVCGKRDDVPRVGCFSGVAFGAGERIARHYRRPQRNERSVSLYIGKAPSS